MTLPRVRAWFSLVGFTCDPREISSVIGITPDQTWKAGEGIGTARTKQKEAGWRIRSQLPPDSDVEEHANWLLDRLPSSISIEPLGTAVYPQFSFVIEIEGEMPAISLAPSTLARIAALRAGIDLDLYGGWRGGET